MLKFNRLFFLAMVAALLAGCSTVTYSTVTNLAPTQYPRDATGFYRVEAEWKSDKSTIRPGSFKPSVVVSFTAYPMRPVPLVEDRWEAFIPVPADKDFILYRYKFDYMEDTFGKPKPNSMMSPAYEMHIVGAK